MKRPLIAAMLALVCLFGCEKNRARPKVVPLPWVSVSLSAGQDRASGGLTERDFNAIMATLPTIERAVPERHAAPEITYGDQTRKVQVCATLVDMQHLLADAGTELAEGRFFHLEDGEHGHPVIVISQSLARDLFPGESALNRSVSLGEHEFKVVGVLGQPQAALLKIDVADVYMDLNPTLEPETLQPVPGGGNNPPTMPLDRIWLEVSDLSNLDSTKTIVMQLLKRNHPEAQYTLGPESAGLRTKGVPE
jgi:hypothetical protein